ncbi:MAG: pseudaminic acid synthase [Bacteroidota bacterium]
MDNEIVIGHHKVGVQHPPFIIAEMSGNHNHDLDRAFAIVDAAAEAGVHALKLQTYTADTITFNSTNPEFLIDNPKSLWYGKNLYELYQEAYTPWEWHGPIFERARSQGLVVFSSPFDETAVDFLEDLDAPAYKVASFENVHVPLLRKIAETGKPVIVSTGASTLADIELAVSTLRESGCKNYVLLKCTSSYPATPENTNILTIPDLAERFDCIAGLSDHTLGIGVALASVSLGARVIEKHITMSRAEGGVDAAFSMEPHEFKSLVEESNRAFEALGNVFYGVTEAEKESLKHKRSIYVVKDVMPGDLISPVNIKVIRPANGLPPVMFDQVIGKQFIKPVKAGTALTLDVINEK